MERVRKMYVALLNCDLSERHYDDLKQRGRERLLGIKGKITSNAWMKLGNAKSINQLIDQSISQIRMNIRINFLQA